MTTRIVVTAPKRRRQRVRRRTVTAEIDAQTQLGEVYMRSLLRAQARLSVIVAGTMLTLLGLVPLLFVLFPGLGEVDVFGVRLPWLALGGGVYPVLVGAAWFYVRAAERVEREFAELVNRR